MGRVILMMNVTLAGKSLVTQELASQGSKK
jgi:hypothetical protein